MREDDRDVREDLGVLAGGAEKGDAVEDVKWEPADGEEEEDQGQGLGELQLLAVVTPGVYVASCYLDDKNIRPVLTPSLETNTPEIVHQESRLTDHMIDNPSKHVRTFLFSCLWIM